MLSRFVKHEQGTAAIEFSLLFPVVIWVFMGIIEFGMMFMASSVLENAASGAARLGLTGTIKEGQTREEMIVETVEEKISSMMKPEKLVFTSKVYENFAQIGTEEPFTDSNGNGEHDGGESYTDINGNGAWDGDLGVAGAGGAGDIVVYTANYQWSFITPLVGHLIGDEDGVIPLMATIVVRNEPF